MLHQDASHGVEHILEAKTNEHPTLPRTAPSVSEDPSQKDEAGGALRTTSRRGSERPSLVGANRRKDEQRQENNFLHRQLERRHRSEYNSRNKNTDDG